MGYLDLRTVLVLSGAMGGVMAIVVVAMRRSYPPSIRGLGAWAAALAMMFLAGVLASRRDALPHLVTINAATALLWFGQYVGLLGSQRFFGQPVRHARWVWPIAVALLVQLWFTHVEPDFRARLMLTTVLTAVLSGVHASLIFRRRPLTFARSLAVGVLALLVLVQLLRLATALDNGASGDFFDGEQPLQLLYITAFSVAILLFSMSMVLMASERLHQELAHLVSHDSLTNAVTRRHLTVACRAELERCRRHGRHLAVLVMDLDHFKQINDTHGHQAGDAVLVRFVATVKGLLRPPDMVGRFGGEEFVAMLPEVTLAEAAAVAERIRSVVTTSEALYRCTVSIGVALSEQPADTVEALVARADAAMYLAKKGGRNRVEVVLPVT